MQIMILTIVATALSCAVPLHGAPRVRQRPAKPSKMLSTPEKTYGSKNAPITMEVFSDYQCPACRALYDQALRPMIGEYVASGKVYLVHHDFPLQMHPYSGQAARWANAAAMIGDFDPAEAALYDNQAAWEADGDIAKFISAVVPAADFVRIESLMKGCELPAPQAKAGITPQITESHPCLLDPYIKRDIELGFQLPVKYTPTYIISYKGQPLAPAYGVVSWPVLKALFDQLLQQ